jgi:hypothetical protein
MEFVVPPGRGGVDLVKELPTTHDKLYARWYQKWEDGYDFSDRNHGGGLHAGPRNYLGASDNRPDGSWFGSWIEPATGGDLDGRLNFYTYYRGMYQNCINPYGSCWGDTFPCMVDEGYYCEKEEHRETEMTPVLETDRWYCIEMMVDAGTPVQIDSLADGRQTMWIDEVEYGPWENLWFRTSSNVKIGILWISRFHHEEHSDASTYYDNIVVSTTRIGCLGNIPPPDPISVQCTNADSNSSGVISNQEMDDYIELWIDDDVNLSDLFNVIDKWKNGC